MSFLPFTRLFTHFCLVLIISKFPLPYITPRAPPVYCVSSAGGTTRRGLGVAGEGASPAQSQPQSVHARAETIPRSGGAKRQAAEEP